MGLFISYAGLKDVCSISCTRFTVETFVKEITVVVNDAIGTAPIIVVVLLNQDWSNSQKLITSQTISCSLQ